MGFRWSDAERGRRIEMWLDRMCLMVPGVMFDVLKAGIGSLDSWFNDTENPTAGGEWDIAKCGCLVGTVALAAKNIKGAVQCISEKVNGYPTEAAWVLYLAICAAKGRKPIDHTVFDTYKSYWQSGLQFLESERLSMTKLPRDLVDTYQVGVFVMEEGDATEIDGEWIGKQDRREDVIDYVMDRIIVNLAMFGYRSLDTLRRHKRGALPIPIN